MAAKKISQKEANYSVTSDVMMKAHKMLEQFRYELPEELRDTQRYCYVKTALGCLEVDVHSLLYLTARVVRPGEVTQIDDVALETALRVIKRLPDYLMHDLVGLHYEEFLRERCDLELHQRELKDKPIEKAAEGSISLFAALLERTGPGLLQCDIFRDFFIDLFSRNGSLGDRHWKNFVKSKIRTKRRPGRPRNSEYDLIYDQRKASAASSYGKLARRLQNTDSVAPAVLLNRVKAAVAYRKRKNL